MANEFKGVAAHSAEYFGDTRDYWWNDDTLEMLSRCWRIDKVRSVLDVGCGVGHWSRALARVLPRTAMLAGIDREQLWVDKAAERAAATGLSERFKYYLASAESLPFDDHTFDLVTCQTLLIHVRDPDQVLAQMVRVARPGGVVVVAEVTNVSDPQVDSIALGDPPDVTAALLRFQLVCQRGLHALGRGNHLIGESLPGRLHRAGLEQVEVRQNDRGWTLIPPYATPFERAQVEEAHDAVERDTGLWDEATTRLYFLSGGGTETEFATAWTAALALRRRVSDAIRAETFCRAGGGLFYVMWGRRPARVS